MMSSLATALRRECSVHERPYGLAVGTSLKGMNDDLIGFYVFSDGGEPEKFHLEDDGMTVRLLDANGIDVFEGDRRAAFTELLARHAVTCDPDDCVLRTAPMSEADIPAAATAFVETIVRLCRFVSYGPDAAVLSNNAEAA